MRCRLPLVPENWNVACSAYGCARKMRGGGGGGGTGGQQSGWGPLGRGWRGAREREAGRGIRAARRAARRGRGDGNGAHGRGERVPGPALQPPLSRNIKSRNVAASLSRMPRQASAPPPERAPVCSARRRLPTTPHLELELLPQPLREERVPAAERRHGQDAHGQVAVVALEQVLLVAGDKLCAPAVRQASAHATQPGTVNNNAAAAGGTACNQATRSSAAAGQARLDCLAAYTGGACVSESKRERERKGA